MAVVSRIHHDQHVAPHRATNASLVEDRPVESTSDDHANEPVRRFHSRPTALSPGDILGLQGNLGNRAVGKLLSHRTQSGKAAPFQLSAAKHKFQRQVAQRAHPGPPQRDANATGMPDALKLGLESQSGVSISDVRVHYNSSKPAAIGALAYTQGTEIHLGPGQESHLPHEGWHAVQQKRGIIAPTFEDEGVAINADSSLEAEADGMSEKALATHAVTGAPSRHQPLNGQGAAISQRAVIQGLWVTSPLATLYKQGDGDDVELGIFRLTEVAPIAPPVDIKISEKRLYVEVRTGKFTGRKGWIDRTEIAAQRPDFANFAIPKIGSVIPPLYHGSLRPSVENIMEGGFDIGKIGAGRTYGDGVYATPYVSHAASHAANAALMADKNPAPQMGEDPHQGSQHAVPEFVVGLVQPTRQILPKNIMVHDMVLEDKVKKNGKGMKLTDATEYQHGPAFTKLARTFLPKPTGKEQEFDLSYKEITAAAKALGKDVIIYQGEPGHIVYVFLTADLPAIKSIVVEGVSPGVSFGWEKLDWYHEAQERDRIQGEMNQLGSL